MTKKLIAEFIGTYMLVFVGTGAIVIENLTGRVTHVGIAISFGLVVTAMIYAFGSISGAHINPAVTLGFWLTGDAKRSTVLPYITVQMIGAAAASLTLWTLFPDLKFYGDTIPRGSDWQSFILEILLTFLLMIVILRIVSGPKENLPLAGLVIGSVVLFEAMFAGPITGASMNPARSFGPALVSGHWRTLWVYLTAPVIGALLAGAVHKLFER